MKCIGFPQSCNESGHHQMWIISDLKRWSLSEKEVFLCLHIHHIQWHIHFLTCHSVLQFFCRLHVIWWIIYSTCVVLWHFQIQWLFFYVNSWIHNDLTVAMVGSSVDLTYEYQVTVLLNGMQMVLVRHDPCLLLHFLCIYICIYI